MKKIGFFPYTGPDVSSSSRWMFEQNIVAGKKTLVYRLAMPIMRL
jgi:hypothetical protein